MERSKSARAASRSRSDQLQGERLHRARSAGANQPYHHSVPDFYTSACGPTASLVTHIRMFSNRAEAMRMKSLEDRAGLRVDGYRRLFTPRNNPQPADAFIHWKTPRFSHDKPNQDKMIRDARRSFQDEYRGSLSPPSDIKRQTPQTENSSGRFTREASHEMPRPTWQTNEDQTYQDLSNQDSAQEESERPLSGFKPVDPHPVSDATTKEDEHFKSQPSKAVSFEALQPSSTRAVHRWLEQANLQERDIALGFLTALVSDSGKDKTSTAVEVLASMPQPQARSKQPSFTLQGKATKQKELTASLGLKDTPLLRSRQHIPEYRRKQLKALMNSIEKEIDARKYIDQFTGKYPQQVTFKPRHQRSKTDPTVYSHSFFSQTIPTNKGYFVIAPDWASERLVT